MNLDECSSEALREYFLGTLGPAWEFSEEDTKRLKIVVELVIRSLEGLAGATAAKAHKLLEVDHELWRWTVDWWYCDETLRTIPKMVDRFLKLSPILVGKTPSKEINTYLREATRSYLWGFFQASIALSRAAIEAGLNERLEKKLGSVPQMKLAEKLHRAARWNLISTASEAFAKKVCRDAGIVLHRGPAATDQLSFDTLIQARRFLLELYEP